MRAGQLINPLIHEARQTNGRRVKCLEHQRLKVVLPKIKRFDCLDLVVEFDGLNGPWLCRLVIHSNLKKGAAPRYLITNLDAEGFSAEHISDAYRLRWQVELLFKEWKSYANLRAFDTANPHIAEGLIWAALCAATLNRYWRSCDRANIQRRYLDPYRRQVSSSCACYSFAHPHTSPEGVETATPTCVALSR